jgi:hypothetical protein
MPLNATLTALPAALPPGRLPVHVLQLICEVDGQQKWMPLAIYPTTVANSFLQLQLPELNIDVCPFAHCRDSKVNTYFV